MSWQELEDLKDVMDEIETELDEASPDYDAVRGMIKGMIEQNKLFQDSSLPGGCSYGRPNLASDKDKLNGQAALCLTENNYCTDANLKLRLESMIEQNKIIYNNVTC